MFWCPNFTIVACELTFYLHNVLMSNLHHCCMGRMTSPNTRPLVVLLMVFDTISIKSFTTTFLSDLLWGTCELKAQHWVTFLLRCQQSSYTRSTALIEIRRKTRFWASYEFFLTSKKGQWYKGGGGQKLIPLRGIRNYNYEFPIGP
jgi:hypothetical protein